MFIDSKNPDFQRFVIENLPLGLLADMMVEYRRRQKYQTQTQAAQEQPITEEDIKRLEKALKNL